MTPIGEQTLMAGVLPITCRDRLQSRLEAPLQPRCRQKPLQHSASSEQRWPGSKQQVSRCSSSLNAQIAGGQQPASGPPPQQFWYYCDSGRGYYPYVTSCPEPWRPVPATPPASP